RGAPAHASWQIPSLFIAGALCPGALRKHRTRSPPSDRGAAARADRGRGLASAVPTLSRPSAGPRHRSWLGPGPRFVGLAGGFDPAARALGQRSPRARCRPDRDDSGPAGLSIDRRTKTGAPQPGGPAAALDVEYWLAPTGPLLTALGAALYAVNRA